MVTASRDWVCVRPATYESAEEAEVLLSYFKGRSGALENTVFALLDSEGELISFRAGRGPSMLYDDPEEMAAELEEHGKAPEKNERRALPRIANLRLAMNVAACDSMPLVVAFASSEKEREQLSQRLGVAAWDAQLVGEAHYVVCAPEELEGFETLEAERGESRSGLYVLDPDDYGRDCEILAKVAVKTKGAKLLAKLVEAVEEHDPVAREHRKHIREGKRQGLEWEGEIPTTDPGERSGGRRER